MMIDAVHERQVHARGRQQRIAVVPQSGLDLRQASLACFVFDRLAFRLVDLLGKHLAGFAYDGGERPRVGAVAGANVRDHGAGANAQTLAYRPQGLARCCGSSLPRGFGFSAVAPRCWPTAGETRAEAAKTHHKSSKKRFWAMGSRPFKGFERGAPAPGTRMV